MQTLQLAYGVANDVVKIVFKMRKVLGLHHVGGYFAAIAPCGIFPAFFQIAHYFYYFFFFSFRKNRLFGKRLRYEIAKISKIVVPIHVSVILRFDADFFDFSQKFPLQISGLTAFRDVVLPNKPTLIKISLLVFFCN